MSRILVIDTETGGTDPRRHSLLSIAGVVWNAGEIGPSIALEVVEPIVVTDPEALAINRIDLQHHQATGMPSALAAARLEAFVRKAFADELRKGERVVLAGHNVGFDVGFLKRLWEMSALDYDALFSHRVLDLASVVRFLHLADLVDTPNASSSEAFAFFGVEPEEARRHTALGDAAATAALLNALLSLMADTRAKSSATE